MEHDILFWLRSRKTIFAPTIAKVAERKGWGPAHATPEEFENEAVSLWNRIKCFYSTLCRRKATLFLQLGLSSTLIRHVNGAFWKRSSNRRKLKTPGFLFREDENHFENDGVTIMRFPVFLKHCCVFKFLPGVVWMAKIWCVSRWNLPYQILPA